MAYLHINPAYKNALDRMRLTTPETFLQMSGVIHCGHPDRNIASLTLDSTLPVYLKREHQVRWKDRLANFLGRFGFVSKSLREFQVLSKLQSLGFGCPEPIAAGENNKGQAFLLLREIADGKDLRTFLATISPSQKHQFAITLGKSIAHLHQAGFAHRDLYSKHILVKENGSLCFLDWQRGCYHKEVYFFSRCRDLATLDATLSHEIFTDEDRGALLQAYLANCRACSNHYSLRKFQHAISLISSRLSKRRRIQEMQHLPLKSGSQNLIWIDGEKFSVTREFAGEMRGNFTQFQNDFFIPPVDKSLEKSVIRIAGFKSACLIKRQSNCFVSYLWNLLRGKKVTSRELKQAALIFRLQRYNVLTPELLAVGQWQRSPWRMDSFLLVRNPSNAIPLKDWLREWKGIKIKRDVLAKAGKLLRTIHRSHCSLETYDWFLVVPSHNQNVTVGIQSLAGIHASKHGLRTKKLNDLRFLLAAYSFLSRSDQLRFCLSYFEKTKLDGPTKLQIRRIVRNPNLYSFPRLVLHRLQKLIPKVRRYHESDVLLVGNLQTSGGAKQ